MSAAKGNANEMTSLKFADDVKSVDSFSSMHFQYPTTSGACGRLPEHTVGCGCKCCCAARTANELCTCPPEMQMSETDSETDKAPTPPPPPPPPKKAREKPWKPVARTLAKEYNVKKAPPPLDVGPRLGGSGYRWQGELTGHIPNCPCERCQLLHGDPYNHTILNSGTIYKFDASYFGKIAHIPNCPCPPCRVKRGLSRLPPPKLPKFKYKPEPPTTASASPTAARIDPAAKEAAEPNYDTHPLNCTCLDCCRALGNDKPFGHPTECKCGLCRRAAGLFKPPGHSDFCTCEFCCAAVGKLKPAGHRPECQCPECVSATEPEPQFDDFINEMPVVTSADTNSMMVVLIALAVLMIVFISWYVYWVGTL